MRPNPFQALPDTVTVGGRAVPVDTDFRVGVAIEQESTAAEPDILSLLTAFYLGNIPAPTNEAGERMIDFYSHSDSKKGGDEGGNGGLNKRNYDFEQDRDVLAASFLSTYGLDLSTVKIHWWEFKRLMCNLPPDCPFMRRIYYRTAETGKMSKSEREHVLKMRRLYALKAPERAGKSAEELDNEFKERAWRRFREAEQAVEAARKDNE